MVPLSLGQKEVQMGSFITGDHETLSVKTYHLDRSPKM